MLLAALALGAALDCADPAKVMAAWEPGVEAFQAQDLAQAKAVTDEIITACGDHAIADFPRLMRAEIALGEEDYKGALAALGPTNRPAPPPVGPFSSFAALRAHVGLKDADAFALERGRLLDGTSQALTDPAGAIKGRLVEAFTVGDTQVRAIEADFANGAFRRHFVFLIASPEPFASPRSIMLTTNPMTSLLGGPQVFFLDEYDCSGHATLDIFERRKPSYKALKAKVVARLSGELNPTSGTQGGVCAFADYIAPGFSRE